MKKIWLAGILSVSLIAMNPVDGFAHSQNNSQCGTYESNAKKCKISKLKAKIKPLWVQKEALGITEDQLDQIKSIKHTAIKELIQLKADKDIVMIDLKSAFYEESIDVTLVNKLIDSKYASKSKSAKIFVKAISDVQNVLTEEQRAKWREMCIQSKLCGSDSAKCAPSS